jgi:ribosome biogenesis GTPase
MQASREQVLAANIDVAFLVQALPLDFNVRRLERYLAMAWESGAQPVVLLTKTDLVDDLAPFLAETESVTLGACPIHAVSARTGAGLEEMGRWFAGNRTAVLLGSSGVGKSTIVNALVPGAGRATGGVNAVTGRGRHTSSSALALELADGGWVIDTPGLRSFGLAHVDLARVIQAFPDLEPGTVDCPRSCTHDEPECALDDWVAAGHSSPARLASLRRLLRSREPAPEEDRTSDLDAPA